MKRKYFILLFGILICLGTLFTGCGKQAEKYKIEFVVDNGIYATIETAGNEQLQLPTEPTKTGFNFGGWYFDLDTWQQVFSADSFINQNLKNDTKVYAKWVEKENESLKVTFEGFDKIDNLTYSKKVSNTTENVYLTDYVGVDHDSTWKLYTNIQATDIIPSKVASLNIGDNTYYVLVEDSQNNVKIYTLQIRRRPLYKITFDTDGGNEIESQFVEEDSFVNLPTAPQKAQHYFLGWNYDFDNAIKNDMLVKALWEENKITYYLDNGTNGNNPTNYSTNDIISLQNANKTGYTFQGWFKDSNYSKKIEQINTTHGNINLYAKFTANPYNITLDTCGGVLDIENIQVIYDSNYELPIPTRDEYYRFEGWFDSNNKKFESDKWQTANDVILYAKWLGKFEFKNGTITGLTEYGKTCKGLQIPEEIEGTKVVEIGKNAFQYSSCFENIDIPQSITTIRERAFEGCNSLKMIYLHGEITTIETYTFTTDTVIFCEAEEKPNGWSYTWQTGTAIYWGVIKDNIIVENNTFYVIEDGVAILVKYQGVADTVEVPTKVNNISIERIGSYAFSGEIIKNITIKENVKQIDWGAFFECKNIETMTLPFIGSNINASGVKADYRYILGTISLNRTESDIPSKYKEDYNIYYCESYGSNVGYYLVPKSLKKISTLNGEPIEL